VEVSLHESAKRTRKRPETTTAQNRPKTDNARVRLGYSITNTAYMIKHRVFYSPLGS